MEVRGKTVFVGLSGGVDSAVSAALLQRAGARVVGVFVKGWYPEGMPCTWREDRKDAMRVAAHLRIPFVTLDASEEYKQGVIDYLVREYGAGRTPNPDVMCNREVKFGAFYRFAREQGADLIATGHYARHENGVLMRGADPDKDQSYFLWAVPKEVLAHTVFPVGGMRKQEVRALAQKFNLPVAVKRDSQGICFLGNISVEDFLRNEFGEQEGIAVDREGNTVGTHNGVLLHTLGERIGLTSAAPGPWYVLQKRIPENVLVVGREPKGSEERTRITLTETNWFSDTEGATEAQYRYHGPVIEGRREGDSFVPATSLTEPLADGQSLVLYAGSRVIGGGIMQSA